MVVLRVGSQSNSLKMHKGTGNLHHVVWKVEWTHDCICHHGTCVYYKQSLILEHERAKFRSPPRKGWLRACSLICVGMTLPLHNTLLATQRRGSSHTDHIAGFSSCCIKGSGDKGSNQVTCLCYGYAVDSSVKYSISQHHENILAIVIFVHALLL